MKKQISLSIAALFAIISINAQTLNPANRVKTALKITKTSKQNMISKTEMMGQDMTQRMDNTTAATYEIGATTEQGATAEIKITALKMEMEMMGQEMSYDSQNPEDGSPEMAEQAKSMMKNPMKLTLDPNGLITSIKGNDKLEQMSKKGNGNLEKGELLDVFLKLSKTVNPGDTWEDKIDTKEEKITSKFTYKTFEDGVATIEKISTVSLDQKIEQMGMTMYSKQDGTIVETYTVDPKTLLIKTKNTVSNLKGTIDAAGKTMPMTSFVTTTDTYQ